MHAGKSDQSANARRPYRSVAAEHMEVFEDLGHRVRFVCFLGRSSRNAEGSLASNDEGNPFP